MNRLSLACLGNREPLAQSIDGVVNVGIGFHCWIASQPMIGLDVLERFNKPTGGQLEGAVGFRQAID